MFYFPINYEEPLYRPPSEANSVILQITTGCSWNKCTYCSMYSSKRFRVKKEEDIFNEIKSMAAYYPEARKFFLADGDALVLSTGKLLRILAKIKQNFPLARRVSAYASARNLNQKSIEELKQLEGAGLKLIYLGIESGSDKVLKRVNKGETAESTVSGLLKAKEAGIKSSVMIINGLGGAGFSEEHAIESARVVNLTQPEYLSTLVLTIPRLNPDFYKGFDNQFKELNTGQLLKEQRTFLVNTELKNSIFRSDHASNFLIFKGTLGRDRDKFVREIDQVFERVNPTQLKQKICHTYHSQV